MSLQFATSAGTVPVHGARRFDVIVRDAAGRIAIGTMLAWRSSDTTVVTVDATGAVSGKRLGASAVITVALGEAAATLPVTVTAGAVEIRGAAPAITVGSTLELAATVRDGLGEAMPDITVSWRSSDTTIATVHPVTGHVLAAGVGTVVVEARGGGVVGSASIYVGIPSPLDGMFVADLAAGHVTLEVQFGRVTRFDATVLLFPNCVLGVSSQPLAPVEIVMIGSTPTNQFRFASSSGAQVTGTYSSPPDFVDVILSAQGDALPSCRPLDVPPNGSGRVRALAARVQ